MIISFAGGVVMLFFNKEKIIYAMLNFFPDILNNIYIILKNNNSLKFMILILLFILAIPSLSIFAEVTVVTEEYVPEVIIEAKWGTNEGEFGFQGGGTSFGEYDTRYLPDSMAVDSKGNIYILDLINNRIQKFNNEGKYIKSISVKSWLGYISGKSGRPADLNKPFENISEVNEIDPIKYRGVNIALDGEDNLYYYCIRKYDKNDQGKWVEREKKGEVWQFNGDKLVKKLEVNISDEQSKISGKLFVEEDVDGKEKVWIGERFTGNNYNVFDKRYFNKKEFKNKIEKVNENKFSKNRCQVRFNKKENGINIYKVIKPNGDIIDIKLKGELYKNGKLLANGQMKIYESKYHVFRYYNKTGILIKICEANPGGICDKDMNVYRIKISGVGIKIIKWCLKKK